MNPKIKEQYSDGESYWIDLAYGWQNGNDPGTHSIVEDTKKKALRQLKNVKPCTCDSCTFALLGGPEALA